MLEACLHKFTVNNAWKSRKTHDITRLHFCDFRAIRERFKNLLDLRDLLPLAA